MSGKHLKNEVFGKTSNLNATQKEEIDQIFKITCEEIYKDFPINYNISDKPSEYELDSIDRCLEEAINMFTNSDDETEGEESNKYSDIENFLDKYSK